METIVMSVFFIVFGFFLGVLIYHKLNNKKEKALNDYQKALEKTRVILGGKDIVLTEKMKAILERQDLINELTKQAMTTKLTKEAFDFIKTIGMVITTAEGKTYIHLPHVFEVASEGYNTVIEHYSDKRLPEDVKNFVIECNIIKEEDEIKYLTRTLAKLRDFRDKAKDGKTYFPYNSACDKLDLVLNKTINRE